MDLKNKILKKNQRQRSPVDAVLQPAQVNGCPAPLCENMGLQEQKCGQGCDGAGSCTGVRHCPMAVVWGVRAKVAVERSK